MALVNALWWEYKTCTTTKPIKYPQSQALIAIEHNDQGRARTQSPTTTNYAVEIPTFGEFARVSTTEVQWLSLALGEPPS